MRRLAVALFAILICFAAHAEVKVGDVPPDFIGKTRDDQAVSLAALHGNVVIVTFWATWCGYCMKELPILAGLQSIASERHLALQVIAVNEGESREIFFHTEHVLKKRLPGLMLTWDPEGKIGTPFKANRFVPVMVMLHRDGTIAHIHSGYGEEMLDTLTAEINELLAEPMMATAAPAAQ